MLLGNLGRLFQAQDLLWTWTDRIIRSRFQQSILGWLWMIVQPAMTVAVFTTIFTLFVPVDTGNIPYVVFSYVALTPWLLLASSLPDMANTLVDNIQLVTKIYFPREILLIAALLARLFDFLIASVLLVGLILFYGMPVFPLGWLYLPVILVTQLALLLGLGLILAAANVFYRDVKPILALVIQIWFYLSPIIYPTSMVPEWLRPLYFLNPMAGILEAYRSIFLYERLPDSTLLLATAVSFLLLSLGYYFFKRVEFMFADIV